MKKIISIFSIVTICILVLINCENSKNDKSGILTFTALDSNYNQILKNIVPFEIGNTISSKKIWTKTIQIDTTIYKTHFSLWGLEDVNDEYMMEHGIKLRDIGTVCFITSDVQGFNRGMATSLPKVNNNPNIVDFTIYLFFIGEGQIMEDITEPIMIRKKNGEAEWFDIEIKNPNKYLIPLSKANLVLTKNEIINNGISDNIIHSFFYSSELENEYIKDNYFIAHVNKILIDNPNIEGINIKDYYCEITPESKYNKKGWPMRGCDFDLTNYTFIFKK